MAVHKLEAFSLECDGCKAVFINGSEFSIFSDENSMIEDSYDYDWIEVQGKHFCPSCSDLSEDK